MTTKVLIMSERGVTYVELVEKLAAIGISEKEVNVANKLSRGKFFSCVYVAMFKRYWIIVIAFGLVLICALVWGIFATGQKLGETKAKNSYHTSRYSAHAADHIKRSCLDGQASNLPECVAEIIRSTKEDQRAQDDLEAQTKMALWAFWMLIATVVMAVITGLGVIFVWRTLLATHDMARDTREIGEAQVRAWVSLTPTSLKLERGETHFGDKGVYFNVIATAKNHGHSPALSVFFHAEVLCFGDGRNEHTILSDFRNSWMEKRGVFTKEQREAGNAIFPGVEMSINHNLFLSFEDIQGKIEGKD